MQKVKIVEVVVIHVVAVEVLFVDVAGPMGAPRGGGHQISICK